jgi:uncharacterized repeat protein (TIGR03803 family)
VFKLDPSGVVTILHSFVGNDGAFPDGGLLRDTDGDLYGVTNAGGTGLGTVFRLDTSNRLKTIHSFVGNLNEAGDGATPASRLVTINGYLYGVTTDGGSSTNCPSVAGGCGTIFRMTKGGTNRVLYSFTGGADGSHPQGLIRDSAGNLYGVASSGGTGSGTVWKLDTSGEFTVLYTFTGGADGREPMGRLIRDATKSTLRGVTLLGGDPKCNCGVVFSLDTGGNERVIHKFFGGGGGSYPSAGLLDVGGVLYGTTDGGGDLICNAPGGCGVLFQIGKAGQYVVLHRFAGSAAGDGDSGALGAVTLGVDGGIYGASVYGGTGGCMVDSHLGCGTIFRYTP